MIPQEAFLSHSSKNREFVSHLANELRRHGVPVWYSENIQNFLGSYLASKLLILMIILKKDAEICFVSLAWVISISSGSL